MVHQKLLSDPTFSINKSENLASPLRVSELVGILKADVERKHKDVAVVGEISSFKRWRSGHCYFDIKDEHCALPAVMFRPHAANIPFDIKDGLLVLFSGRVSIYAASSRLQMVVDSMEPLGQGALALAFEQMKSRLMKEGLFDEKHKLRIKDFNARVGIITSSHGAALRDMIRILKNRMPKVDILLCQSRVQGIGSSVEIANAIKFLDQSNCCDVIIVGRGGGSLEDLWAFNEEVVARAIFHAKTPIISAVGHETDTTISDFVADIRAATPTHAASLAVPKLSDLESSLSAFLGNLNYYHGSKVKEKGLLLADMKSRIKDPQLILFRHWQNLDESQNKLQKSLRDRLEQKRSLLRIFEKNLRQLSPFTLLRRKRDHFGRAQASLMRLSPVGNLMKAMSQLEQQKILLNETVDQSLICSRQKFLSQIDKLEALSPLRVLSRGFAMVEDDVEGSIIMKSQQLMPNQSIKIRFKDGFKRAQIAS